MKNRNQLKSPRHAGGGMIIGTIAFAMLAFSGLQARTWTSAEGGKTFEGELQSYDPESGKVTVTLANRKRMNWAARSTPIIEPCWPKLSLT